MEGAREVEDQGGNNQAAQLRCNTCWEPLINQGGGNGLSYRTACCHVFCQNDAYQHFGEGNLICPACHTDLNNIPGGIVEITLRSNNDPKILEAIWEETLVSAPQVLTIVQQALEFVMYQMTQESLRQEFMRNEQAEEMKSYQSKYTDRYMQLKAHSDKVEAEVAECRTKISSLKTSNEELRHAFKEKSRKARNWEKLYKAARSQAQAAQEQQEMSLNQLLSPRSTRSGGSPISERESVGHSPKYPPVMYKPSPRQVAIPKPVFNHQRSFVDRNMARSNTLPARTSLYNRPKTPQKYSSIKRQVFKMH